MCAGREEISMEEEYPEIAMQTVESSNIHSCGHCPKTNTLSIKFKSGGTYHFNDFSVEDFTRMQRAKSIGKFFHSDIRGKFEGKRV